MKFAIEGLYQDGNVELVEKPDFQEPVEVLVVFLEKKRKISKLRGIFKNFAIDYEGIGQDLKELSRNSEANILDEFENGA